MTASATTVRGAAGAGGSLVAALLQAAQGVRREGWGGRVAAADFEVSGDAWRRALEGSGVSAQFVEWALAVATIAHAAAAESSEDGWTQRCLAFSHASAWIVEEVLFSYSFRCLLPLIVHPSTSPFFHTQVYHVPHKPDPALRVALFQRFVSLASAFLQPFPIFSSDF